jgi:uncharacterized protein (DUF927 family)
MDKRTIKLAKDWYRDAGIKVRVEGTKFYTNVNGFDLELSQEEILWRAECQIHLID